MKFSAFIFFVLFLSGCEPFSYKFHIIVTEVPVNLGALNSAYDDWNSDLPFPYERSEIWFSSNRNSFGGNFDIVAGRLDFSYHEDHNILGCQYIGIGMMPERYRSPEAVAGFADEFLRAAELFHKAGKKMMYHHHAMEWERVTPDKTMLDVILEKMPQEVLGITLDTYWVQAAGADVCDTIQALKDRIPCVHLKDMAIKGFEQRMAVVGEGNLPFNKILTLLKAQGTTKYLLVEQDNSYGEDPFACLKRSYEFLKGEGYQ